MNQIQEKLDKWAQKYEGATEEKQYKMILDLVNDEISEKALSDNDFEDYLLELFDGLILDQKFKKAVFLIQSLSSEKPKLYKQLFPFLNAPIILYFLHKDDSENLNKYLEMFLKYPDQNADFLYNVLYNIIFYGHTDLAVKIAKEIHSRIANSPKLLDGAESELDEIVFYDTLSSVFKERQKNKDVDWNRIANEMLKYNYKITADIQKECDEVFISETIEREEIQKIFENSREKGISRIELAFCKYMFVEKNMSFINSVIIFSEVFQMIENRKSGGKRSPHIERFFSLKFNDIDHYLGTRMGFLGLNVNKIFAVLWGLRYVYDFLKLNELITEAVYEDVASSVEKLKDIIIKTEENSLWRYAFVCRWPSPISLYPESYRDQCKAFALKSE